MTSPEKIQHFATDMGHRRGYWNRNAPKVACICGSMRFYNDMLYVAQELSLRGEIVVMPFVRIDVAVQRTSLDKVKLDDLHRYKIAMSDYVVIVTDKDGYIGESTTREVHFARGRNLPIVRYWIDRGKIKELL